MKLYFDYNKQYKFFLVVLFFVLVFLPVYFLSAQSVSELRGKISERDADIAKLEKEIATYQSELNILGQQKNSLAGAIKELDLTKKKLNTDIAVTQNKIQKTNLMIESLSRDIGNKASSISNSIDSIILGIRATNEVEQATIVETILSEQGLIEAWNDLDNIMTVRESIREKVKELKLVKGELEDTRQETIDAKAELTALKSELSSQQKIVIQNTNEKNKLLAQTKNSEANYQQLLQDRIIQKEKFEKELEDFEAQLQFVLDPSKLPKKGVLSWPLDKVFVTSPFGMRSRGFHYGTDFRASVGTSVKAMSDGTVLGVGDTDICCSGASFGKWIFIEYNNGLSSIYGHLSLISVQKGKKVKRGEVVGYTGNTGSSTGPHLHLGLTVSSGAKVSSFESKSYPGKILVQPIVAKKAYLDPMYYLPFYK
jgi:murein DD-endopeptidase MepM/ murein hydrolase activator NlpD